MNHDHKQKHRNVFYTAFCQSCERGVVIGTEVWLRLQNAAFMFVN